MSLTIIVAMDRNMSIGDGKKLLWRIPSDLKYFKKMTMGKILIVGRKTYETLPKLKGRELIVVSSKKLKDIKCANNVNATIDLLNGKNAYVIGGAMIYKMFLKFTNFIDMTLVNSNLKGIKFPEIERKEWEMVNIKNVIRLKDDDYETIRVMFERKGERRI